MNDEMVFTAGNEISCAGGPLLNEKTAGAVPGGVSSYGQPRMAAAAGVPGGGTASSPAGAPAFGLAVYAGDKHLPGELLAKLGLREERDRGGVYVGIPYYGRDGSLLGLRKRYAGRRFRWRTGDRVALYGLWLLPAWERGNKPVILVEGESDAQSLWQLGIPALGVPGASTFDADMAKELLNIPRLIIHDEKDQGGQTFVRLAAKSLRESGCTGEAAVFSCRDIDPLCKDPSDLFVKYGQAAAGPIVSAAAAAAPLEILPVSSPVSAGKREGFPPLDIPLTGTPWLLTDEGVMYADRHGKMLSAVRTPFTVSGLIRPAEGGAEMTELCWPEDGRIRRGVFPSCALARRGDIVEPLRRAGILVDSENSRYAVSYISDVLNAGRGVIPVRRGADKPGWYDGADGRPFGAFRPACDERDDLVDLTPPERGAASSPARRGTLDSWLAAVRPFIYEPAFAAMLGASFASVLLAPLGIRPFCLYIWCKTRSGKTAALRTALSVWGDPDLAAQSFNSTAVALERYFALRRHLPAAVDEKQLHSGDQLSVDKLIYTFGSGRSKGRGTKEGGMQKEYFWDNIMLATGEEPLTNEYSDDGADTRVLTLNERPFDSEEAASQAWTVSRENFGTAGPEFIRTLRRDYLDREGGLDDLRELLKAEEDFSGPGETDAAHLPMKAVISLSYKIALRGFLAPDDRRAAAAADSLSGLLSCGGGTREKVDKDAAAADLVREWIMSNRASFAVAGSSGANARPAERSPALGELRTKNIGGKLHETALVYPSSLAAMLEKNGFNRTRTLRYMAEKGILIADAQGRNTCSIRLACGTKIRMNVIDLGESEICNDNEDNI